MDLAMLDVQGVRSEAEKVNMPNYLYIPAYTTMTVE